MRDDSGRSVGSRSGEAGFTLAMVMIIVAIMAIMMGVAVSAVSFQMRREREAELIFRGRQYIEAIRLYKKRFGRYPMRLKEIWEADPKVIRKQWKDPITGSESWGLVFLGQEGDELGGQARPGGARGGPPMATPTPSPAPGGGGRGAFGEHEKETVGPIVGVHSTSCEESIKVYEGRTRYCDWKFVYREDKQQQRGGGGGQYPWGMPSGGARPSPGAGGGGPPPGGVRPPHRGRGPTPTPRL